MTRTKAEPSNRRHMRRSIFLLYNNNIYILLKHFIGRLKVSLTYWFFIYYFYYIFLIHFCGYYPPRNERMNAVLTTFVHMYMKIEPCRSEAEHATSRSLRLPTAPEPPVIIRKHNVLPMLVYCWQPRGWSPSTNIVSASCIIRGYHPMHLNS